MNRLKQIHLIASMLRVLRENKGYSQEYVRNATGYDVSHFECGHCKPGLHLVMGLCDFYGINFNYIVNLAEDVDNGLLSEKECYARLRRSSSGTKTILKT